MQFTTMPSYELGQRYSLDRPSSKYRRAARRLRRQGYAAAAQQMALEGEKIRLNEPTIMTPDSRALQRRSEQRIAAMSQAGPSFDPTADMADLRGAYFADVSAAKLPASERAMFAKQFQTELGGISRDRKAFVDLQIAQRKNREEQLTAQIRPQVASRIQQILDSKGTDSQKQKALVSTMMTPAVSSVMKDTGISTLFTRAGESLKTSKADQDKLQGQIMDLAKSGGDITPFEGMLSPVYKDITKSVQRLEQTKLTRSEQLKELEDIEGMLFRLEGAGSSDPLVKELLASKGIGLEGKTDKEVIINLIQMLKYPLGEMPKEELAALNEKETTTLFNEAFGILARQKRMLSMRRGQELTAPNVAAETAASSWSE
jgi:hypothetical protein